jgi:hypothetical protein
VTDERAAAAEDESDHLPRRIGAVDERERQQRAAERADDAVDAVPDAVDPRDLVGQKLGERTDCGDAHDPGVRQYLQRLQMFGQRQPAEMHRDAGCQDREVETPARQQADAARDPQYFGQSHCLASGRAKMRHLAPS